MTTRATTATEYEIETRGMAMAVDVLLEAGHTRAATLLLVKIRDRMRGPIATEAMKEVTA